MNNVVVKQVKNIFGKEDVQSRIKEMLDNNSQGFVTSVLNIITSNNQLQNAEPNSIVKSAMIAASLKLPVDPNLGFAAIVPYGKEAQFQIMYKGLTQLAIRSGQYRTINVTEVYEDEIERYNPFTGTMELTDHTNWKQRYIKDGKVVGYYAYFELTSGFKKELYMTKPEVEAHAMKYSKSYQYDKKKGQSKSRWSVDFDAMGKKTVLKSLLSKFGILSIEMQKAVEFDQANIRGDINNPQPAYNDNPDFVDKEVKDPFKNAIEIEKENYSETDLTGTPFDKGDK